jgi:hypothetical protein
MSQLPEATMQALVKEFYPYNTAFDPVADRLIDTSPPAMSMGKTPEPYDPMIDPRHVPHDPNRLYGYSSSKAVDVKPARRPGFA